MFVGIINVSQYPPSSGQFLGPFIAGVVVCIALGVWEIYGTKNPLLHPFLFARFRTFTLICIVTFLSGGLFFYGFQALFPQYLVLVFGSDARQTGLDGMPLGAGTWIGGVGSLFLLRPIGRRIGTTPILIFGAFATALFVPLLALVDGSPSSKSMVYGFTCFAGFGEHIHVQWSLGIFFLTSGRNWHRRRVYNPSGYSGCPRRTHRPCSRHYWVHAQHWGRRRNFGLFDHPVQQSSYAYPSSCHPSSTSSRSSRNVTSRVHGGPDRRDTGSGDHRNIRCNS